MFARKWRINITAVLIVVLSLGIPMTAFANSMPVYIDEYPAFDIAPMEDCPVKVDKEQLTFKIDERSSADAMVSAEYTLSNTSEEYISVPMVFPFVSDGYWGPDANIEFNGKAVDYKVYNAGYVDVKDYLKEPDAFKKQVDIHTIIENLNSPLYKAKHFDDTADAALYKVTFTKPMDREGYVSFNINTETTRVLTFGFNGFTIDKSGSCTVCTNVGDNHMSETGFILVLGKDTLTDIESNAVKLEKSTVNSKAYILDRIAEDNAAGYAVEMRDMDSYYAQVIRTIDYYWEESLLAFGYDMVKGDMGRYNNIYALLYEVDFEPESTNTLKVAYPMEATFDRRETTDYINTFVYIVNPAEKFLAFGPMDIRVEMNARCPYIIDSSIPFTETEAGVYAASLDGLPAEDVVFSTYPHKEITFLDRTAARVLPRGYAGILLGFAAAVLGLAVVVVVVFLMIKRKKKAFHDEK